MRTVLKKVYVFNFNELSEQAKDKAVNAEIDFIMEVTPYEEAEGGVKKAYDKAEQMQTPWFTGSYIYEYCKEEILEALNECEFLENGDFYFENPFTINK